MAHEPPYVPGISDEDNRQLSEALSFSLTAGVSIVSGARWVSTEHSIMLEFDGESDCISVPTCFVGDEMNN